jgi:hypothetical protein
MNIINRVLVFGVPLTTLLLVVVPAVAQPRTDQPRPAPPPSEPPAADTAPQVTTDDFDIDYDSEPPYDLYERHWRREARDYGSARYRYDKWRGGGYYGRPGWRYYDDGRYDGYYGGEGFDEGYWEGRRDGRRYAEWERRNELGRRSYTDAMSDGLLAFRNGDYSAAALNFIRAAKVNQGDPASRIHAAHAMVALGRYAEALPALRRAFQLQPKLAYLGLDIRRDYGPRADFDTHLNAVANAAREAAEDPALWLLLGYYQFYSGHAGDALVSLTKSDELAPGDFMTEALLDAARSVAPVAPAAPAEKAPPAAKAKPAEKAKPRPGAKQTPQPEAPPPPPVPPPPQEPPPASHET